MGRARGLCGRGVHRLLGRLPEVQEYFLADTTTGGWGATWVVLNLNTAIGKIEVPPKSAW